MNPTIRGHCFVTPKWIDRIHRYAYKNKKGNSDWFKSNGPSTYDRRGSGRQQSACDISYAGFTGRTARRHQRVSAMITPSLLPRCRNDWNRPWKSRAWSSTGVPRRNMINRARDAAGWASTKGRHAVWCASRSQVAMP